MELSHDSPVMWRTRLAACVGVLAALVGVRTLVAYFSHGAYFALATVAVLIVMDGAGLYSLLRARAAVAAEWRELFRPEPASRLWTRRRDRLLALKALQTPPDVDALIAVDEAELAGLASLWRYLVAASVLIGLVGTFAGLSETIAGFAPVMSDAAGDTSARLLVPLAGLEVTFGASIVAIIATLALSLASGDLALVERALLARLDERTRHELMPQIFPAAESLAAQTLRALTMLSGQWADTTTAHATRMDVALERTAARLAHDAQTAAETMTRASLAATQRLEALTQALAATFADAARDSWVKSSVELQGAAARLDAAAQALSQATDKFHPSVERLVPELAALSREAALLAARVDDAEVDEAVLAEMQRLGDAMSEIKALLTLGRAPALAEAEAQ
jgi:hypothetical protein